MRAMPHDLPAESGGELTHAHAGLVTLVAAKREVSLQSAESTEHVCSQAKKKWPSDAPSGPTRKLLLKALKISTSRKHF
jgi:hypothetical protein